MLLVTDMLKTVTRTVKSDRFCVTVALGDVDLSLAQWWEFNGKSIIHRKSARD